MECKMATGDASNETTPVAILVHIDKATPPRWSVKFFDIYDVTGSTYLFSIASKLIFMAAARRTGARSNTHV